MSTALERKSKQLWKKEKYEFYAAAAVPCWTFGEEIFSKAGLYTGFVLWEISGCEFFEKCLGKGLLLSAIGDRIACTGGKTVLVKIFPAKGDKDDEKNVGSCAGSLHDAGTDRLRLCQAA